MEAYPCTAWRRALNRNGDRLGLCRFPRLDGAPGGGTRRDEVYRLSYVLCCSYCRYCPPPPSPFFWTLAAAAPSAGLEGRFPAMGIRPYFLFGCRLALELCLHCQAVKPGGGQGREREKERTSCVVDVEYIGSKKGVEILLFFFFFLSSHSSAAWTTITRLDALVAGSLLT